MPTWLDLEGYCGETSSALIMLAAMVLSPSQRPVCSEAAGHGGVAFAITGLLRSFPWHTARGQTYLPVELIRSSGITQGELFSGQATLRLRSALAEARSRVRDHMQKLRASIGAVRPAEAPAFLHLALIEPYLDQMEQADYDPFRTMIDLGDLKRMYVIWRQSRLARKANGADAEPLQA